MIEQKLRTYTQEQEARMSQFWRAFNIVDYLIHEMKYMEEEGSLSVYDKLVEGRYIFDPYTTRIAMAATFGMFEECLDLNLEMEIKGLMEDK